ncbi:MAG: glycoside hydrolase family 25 protein [Legionellales bacterium]|nr:glycoside hydrolase family 25 protein [Legionellales bacterium]
MQNGIDVSEYQGVIHWENVANDPLAIQFVFVRSTIGITGIDKYFYQNYQGVVTHNLAPGIYHVFKANEDGYLQAEALWNVVSRLSLHPEVAFDVETAMGEPPASVLKELTKLVERYNQLSNSKNIIYTNPNFWKNFIDVDFSDRCALWISEYGVSYPQIPLGWRDWKYWQYSQTGTISGIQGAVDLNYRNTSAANAKLTKPL